MKTKAVFTMQHNERVFLPIWLTHYSKYFKPEDIYVISHKTDRGMMNELLNKFSFNERIEGEGELYSASFIVDRVSKMQKELLGKYEYVLYTDIDEMVWSPEGLDNFIDNFNENYTYCTGYEVIHKADEEPPIDFAKPLLRQRKYWGINTYHCKPLLSKIPLQWGHGFHGLRDVSESPRDKANPNLFLLHLKRIDWDEAKKRWFYTGTDRATTTSFEEHFNVYNNLMVEIPEEYKNII